VKQIKIIHGVTWSAEELDAYKRIIRGNYVNGLQEVVQAAQRLGLKIAPENTDHEKHIAALRARTVELTPDLLTHIQTLWKDPAVQDVVKNHSEQITITHLPYFFEHIQRISADDFTPTDEDILRCRQRTAGASSTTVYIEKNYFEFFDIGGQKPERAKWESVINEHKFSSVIYFVASDEFDVEDEDREFQRTKMEISRFVFSEIVNSNMLDADVPIILFVNRQDLFTQRFNDDHGYQQFQAIFPNYTGGRDAQAGLAYVKDLFLATVNDPQNCNIKTHYTCALDTESMVVVWRSVREFLLKKALTEMGF
jgi:GTPase SAR1 family protein